MTESLLVELFTEELPPKALKQLGEAFATELHRQLARRDLLEPDSELTWYATPRRLAARLTEVRDKSPDRSFDQKLVPAKVGFDKKGNATPALLKKLTAVGHDESVVSQVVRRDDGKIEMLYLPSVASGLVPSAA